MLVSALFAIKAPVAPMLLVHVMPWFTADERELGWHWRMNRTTKEVRESGRVASHYRPLIGPYDSGDPLVLDLQVQWMKLAGFDGALADWYGLGAHFDYPQIHRRTTALFKTLQRAGMKIGVVYEDQSIGNAVKQKLITEDQVAGMIDQLGMFFKNDWFKSPSWIRFENKPVLPVFGPQLFTGDQWTRLRTSAGPFQLVSLHNKQTFADGVMDWPLPRTGVTAQSQFVQKTKNVPLRMTVTFPRFKDFYAQGGQTGYPEIPDAEGRTYAETLAQATSVPSFAVQVATWNDWQEGTQIEPSIELKFRDLVATQRVRRKLDPKFRFSESDLEFALRLYKKRRVANSVTLDAAAEALLKGDVASARRLAKLEDKSRTFPASLGTAGLLP